jgi:hypothetical protein
MKTSIRRGVFETNSSSTHSLTICTKDLFSKWTRGEVVLNCAWGIFNEEDDFIPIAELPALIKKAADYDISRYGSSSWPDVPDDVEDSVEKLKAFAESLYDCDLFTYDYWSDDYDLETYDSSFTTPSGDEMVAFGKYGYDG